MGVCRLGQTALTAPRAVHNQKIDKKRRIPHNRAMSAVAFDTLEVSQNLEAAGFTPGQASRKFWRKPWAILS